MKGRLYRLLALRVGIARWYCALVLRVGMRVGMRVGIAGLPAYAFTAGDGDKAAKILGCCVAGEMLHGAIE